MKHLGLTAASSVLILMSGSVVAQQDTGASRTAGVEPAQECLDELERLGEQYDESELSQSARQEVRQLTQTARMLGQRGREDACDTMVQTISEITEEERSQMQAQAAGRTKQDAQPLTKYSGIVRASSINGATVRNAEDQELGSIEDAVIDPQSGEISYVVLSIGGFLGVGQRLVAVPWEELQIVEGSGEEPDHYVVSASRSYLEQQPGLDQEKENWPRKVTQRWDSSEARKDQ